MSVSSAVPPVTAPQLSPEWHCGSPAGSPITICHKQATLELFYSSPPCFLSLPTLRQSLTAITSSSAPRSNLHSKHSKRRFDLPSSSPSPDCLVHPGPHEPLSNERTLADYLNAEVVTFESPSPSVSSPIRIYMPLGP